MSSSKLWRARFISSDLHHSHKLSSKITNTAFADWGNILYNTTIATAIADRLMENSEIFLLGGDSLRKGNRNPNPPAAE